MQGCWFCFYWCVFFCVCLMVFVCMLYLVVLLCFQQFIDLIGFEDVGQVDEVLFFGVFWFGQCVEFFVVVKYFFEGGDGVECGLFVFVEKFCGCGILLFGVFYQFVIEQLVVGCFVVECVVVFLFEFGGQCQQNWYVWYED